MRVPYHGPVAVAPEFIMLRWSHFRYTVTDQAYSAYQTREHGKNSFNLQYDLEQAEMA